MRILDSGSHAEGLDKTADAAKPLAIILDVPSCAESVTPEPPMPDALTPNEQQALEYWERDVRNNLTSFIKAGRALAIIRDKRLYRQAYPTFEQYCSKKWQLGKSHAYRLIGEADIHRYLSPIGDKMPPPANEAQCRELLGLTPEQTVQAWKNALTSAEGKRVTAKMVRAAAAEFKSVKKAQNKSSDSGTVAEGSNSSSAFAGATGGFHGSCMKHDRQASSGLSPATPEVEWSENEERDGGGDVAGRSAMERN